MEALAGMVVQQLQPQLVAMQEAITTATATSFQAFQTQLFGQLQQMLGVQQPHQGGL